MHLRFSSAWSHLLFEYFLFPIQRWNFSYLWRSYSNTLTPTNENKFSGPQHFWNQLSFVLYPIGRYAIPKKIEMKKKKQPTHAKTVSVKIPQWITTQNKKRKRKEEDKYHDNKKKNRKDSKNKMQIPRGGVTRPPSQFESYSLSASSKSYSGRSYSAPKPD